MGNACYRDVDEENMALEESSLTDSAGLKSNMNKKAKKGFHISQIVKRFWR